MVMLSLSGCSDGSSTSQFKTADYRFAGNEDLPFERTQSLNLPAGPHTLRISVQADDGFGIDLVSPDGARNGFTHSYDASIRALEYTTAKGEAGLWELSYGCDGPCDYVIAVDEGASVTPVNVPTTALGTKAHVAGDLSGATDDDERVESITVLEDNVTVVFNVHGTNGVRWSLHDAADDLVSFWRFDGITARDWEYRPARLQVTPGEWRVGIECDSPCQYNFGVDWR